MAWSMAAEDDFDGVQYDDMYAPSAVQLEAEQIRRECAGQCTRCGHQCRDRDECDLYRDGVDPAVFRNPNA